MNENPKRLNHAVFWPPFLLLLVAVALNLIAPAVFLRVIKVANDWVLAYFGWMFTLCALSAMVLCGIVWLMPIGRCRIGGKDAKPRLTRWNWFAITLCTTVAVGILFWSTAEPLSHFHFPPKAAGIESQSPQARQFAISTLYLHWSFVPYSIYCAASLMFALAHFNLRQPYSLGSTLVPLFGVTASRRVGPWIDAVCLYSLVAGMAAALGTGILTISGGLHELLGVGRNQWVWLMITVAIVGTFIASSASGLMKGIRILSDINARFLVVLVFAVFLMGSTASIFSEGVAAIGDFIYRFPSTAIVEGFRPNDDGWAYSWSIFYWAVWIAWTPVTACFLGSIGYGRTVREFITFNLLLPSLFCMFWMAVFGATTLDMEAGGAGLLQQMQEHGTESVSYAVLANLPLGVALVSFFLVSAFVCFVTSADSNTTAMASLSVHGTNEDTDGSTVVKIAWGVLVGATAWTMISSSDVEGIRMLSNLGGVPAAILLFFVFASLLRVTFSPAILSEASDESLAPADDDTLPNSQSDAEVLSTETD